ncbi:anti-sigma-D factor RsdA [Nocardia sp. NPDC058666]|uniref:anti-sigma-D factor RsdA n=1 Tax=unclassified Nocardia TaxID=2637762 RepID=UPI003661D8B7
MARDGEHGLGKSGPYAAEGAGDSGPVDIAAVRSDDALIDAIIGDGPVRTDSPEEFQLASLLADWRADVLAAPMPAGPDLDTVFAAVNQEIGARQVRVGASSRGRLRLVRPIFGAAAALSLVFGGITAFAYSAAPGDPLWRVKEVVFSEQAQSTVVQYADEDLLAAQNLLTSGDPEQAKARLEQASSNAGQVDDPVKRDDLIARWNLLRDQLLALAPEIGAQLPPTTVTPAKPTTQAPVPPTSNPGSQAPVAPTGPGGSTDPQPPVILETPGPETKPVVPPVEPTQPPVTTPPPVTPPVTVDPTTPPTTIAEPPPVIVPTVVPTSEPLPPTVPSTLQVPPAATILQTPPTVPSP